jgi:Carboxypeptidase regulatory-like domain
MRSWENTDMRKLALLLVMVMVAPGVPAGIFAQAPSSLATISGEALDAGGRALISQRVELVRDGAVVGSTTTGSRGEWSFTNVMAGDYVVRVVVSGQVAGIRVSVAPGQMVANALIVAPSAAVPSAAFLGLGLVGGTLVAAAATAAILTTVILVTGS